MRKKNILIYNSLDIKNEIKLTESKFMNDSKLKSFDHGNDISVYDSDNDNNIKIRTFLK